jgi:hypothetical protein
VADPILAVVWSRTATRTWYAPRVGTGTSSVYNAPCRSASASFPGATRISKTPLTLASGWSLAPVATASNRICAQSLPWSSCFQVRSAALILTRLRTTGPRLGTSA